MKVWPLCDCSGCWLFFLLLMADEREHRECLEIYLTALFQNAVQGCASCPQMLIHWWLRGPRQRVSFVGATSCIICLVASLPLTYLSWAFQHPQDPKSPPPSDFLQPRAAHQALASSQWLRLPLRSVGTIVGKIVRLAASEILFPGPWGVGVPSWMWPQQAA